MFQRTGQTKGPRRIPRATVALVAIAFAFVAAACTGDIGDRDGGDSARSDESSERPAGDRSEFDEDRPELEPLPNLAEDDGGLEQNVAGAASFSAPPWWDPARLDALGADQRSDPASGLDDVASCDTIVEDGQSIQDAIDAVVDRTTPFVMCVRGEHEGGGAPPEANRPGIGPYYGGIRILERENFTLRGLAGSRIVGVTNDDITPSEEAAPEEQHPNDKAILVKVESGRNVTLEGLHVDGFADGDPTLNRLIWLQDTTDSTVRYNTILNAGGECVRLKTNSQRNEIHHNEIAGCGVWQMRKDDVEDRLRKNGEAIYIGTDPAQIATTQINKSLWFGLDPTLATDRSSFNWVHHNRLAPGPDGSGYGNECVDIKEDWPEVRSDLAGDAERGEPGNNWVTDNECSGQFDDESGGFGSRGPNNVFTHNRVFGDIKGASIRIGGGEKEIGDTTVDWKAVDNEVRLNVFESYGLDAPVKAWDDQPLRSGYATCGNVDKNGALFDSSNFSTDSDAALNLRRCRVAGEPAGPRGQVGVPGRSGSNR